MPRDIRYVEDVSNGWLRVKLNSGQIIPLPYLLKVEFEKRENGRDYFKILEGEHKNANASVSQKSAHSSYLVRLGAIHKPGASCEFDKSSKTLTITGLGSFNAFTADNNPIPNGVYDIQIPAAPHGFGASYTGYSVYAKTWFRVGSSGSRFLHPGRNSLGCITVTDVAKWTEIYNYLIQRRKSDTAVGSVKVK